MVLESLTIIVILIILHTISYNILLKNKTIKIESLSNVFICISFLFEIFDNKFNVQQHNECALRCIAFAIQRTNKNRQKNIII